MDIKELVCKEIIRLQQDLKEDFNIYCSTNIEGVSLKRCAKTLNPNILKDAELISFYKTLLMYSEEAKSITQEAFNEIIDLRPYLINSPRDYTQDCLHYLGDDAQNWWFERKFTEGFKQVESLLEESRVTEAFERYFSLETVRRYHENASEQLAYLKEVNQKIGNGFNSSYEAEFLAIIENFKFLLKLSKRHHLKI